jgi:hypothetical protein
VSAFLALIFVKGHGRDAALILTTVSKVSKFQSFEVSDPSEEVAGLDTTCITPFTLRGHSLRLCGGRLLSPDGPPLNSNIHPYESRLLQAVPWKSGASAPRPSRLFTVRGHEWPLYHAGTCVLLDPRTRKLKEGDPSLGGTLCVSSTLLAETLKL